MNSSKNDSEPLSDDPMSYINLSRDRESDFLYLSTIYSAIPSQIPSFNSEAIVEGCKELLVRGCETVIAVLGMTSVVSSISHEIGSAIQWFLSSEAPEDRGIGTVSAILFFILALQTGITGMEPDKRFTRLYRFVSTISPQLTNCFLNCQECVSTVHSDPALHPQHCLTTIILIVGLEEHVRVEACSIADRLPSSDPPSRILPDRSVGIESNLNLVAGRVRLQYRGHDQGCH